MQSRFHASVIIRRWLLKGQYLFLANYNPPSRFVHDAGHTWFHLASFGPTPNGQAQLYIRPVYPNNPYDEQIHQQLRAYWLEA